MSIVSGTIAAFKGSEATENAATTAANATTSAASESAAATNEAAKLSYQAQQDYLNTATKMYNTNISLLQPYYTVGTNAIPTYEKMLNGGYDMEESPAAQYQLTQSTKSLNRSLASRGLSGSGNAANRLTELNSSIAASDYQNQYNRILNALQIGQSSASAMAGVGSSYTNAAGQSANATSSTANSSASTLANILQNASGTLSNIYTNKGNNQASLYSGLAGQSANTAALGLKAYQAYNAGSTTSGSSALSDSTWGDAAYAV